MNKLDKINYIKENINQNKIKHEIINNFIKENNVDYIKNNNGIFIVINKLDEKKLNLLYNIIFKYKENKKLINKDITIHEKKIKKEKQIINKQIKTIKSPYVDLNINFTNQEKQLMLMSRNF